MRKLVLTCQCGQRMQVPRAAVGRTGMCPSCGQIVKITADTAVPQPAHRWNGDFSGAKTSWWRGQSEPSEDAKQRFGQAVDLYYARRYAESLAVFDALLKQFPGNPDVERGRNQCVNAMRHLQLPGPQSGAAETPPQDLTLEAIKRVVLDKMLHGASDEIQLRAAELAARVFGLSDNHPLEPAPAPTNETDVPTESPAATESSTPPAESST